MSSREKEVRDKCIAKLICLAVVALLGGGAFREGYDSIRTGEVFTFSGLGLVFFGLYCTYAFWKILGMDI